LKMGDVSIHLFSLHSREKGGWKIELPCEFNTVTGKRGEVKGVFERIGGWWGDTSVLELTFQNSVVEAITMQHRERGEEGTWR